MKHFLFILFFVYSIQLSFSQSISSYVIDANNKIISKIKIWEIIETTTFYLRDEEKKDIEYKTYDTSMNILTLVRNNAENKLIFQSIFTYDSLKRIIRIDKKNAKNKGGFQNFYTIYKYDSLSNFTQTDYNENGNIVNTAKFYFDKDKNLIRLETYTGDGSLIGYEVAEYNLQDNLLIISQYDNKNQQINKLNRPISHDSHYKQKATNKYNEHGDIIYKERDQNENDKTCYITEYKYDKFGNWTSEKRYSYIKNEKGELKQEKLEMIKKRDIKYLKK
jgi:hypothetical protein